ncbi:MAG: CinA family protein [Victivallaceae bacterium]|nr:CinA family protein [Victivallaceae bacterium]
MNHAESLVRLLTERKLTVATAESCTGGLVAGAITSVPGSSEVFPGGVVSYANRIKETVLHVPSGVLEQHGAVSAECAEAMLDGVRALLGAECAVCTTGIAGPGGGTKEKPVGLVYIGAVSPERRMVLKQFFSGGRDLIRRQAVERALELLWEILN